MKRAPFFGFLLILLVVGGGLSAIFAQYNTADFMPVITQTNDPAASVMRMEGWQAEQLFIWVGFVLFNLVGIAGTIAAIMWYLDRQVKTARAQSNAVQE